MLHIPTFSALTHRLRRELAGQYPEREAGSVARLVVEFIAGRPVSLLLADPDAIPDSGQLETFERILGRLKTGEPVQYVLGETEFCGLKLKVGPGVLIPRGETEELVEWAVKAGGQERRKAEGVPGQGGPRFRGDDNLGGTKWLGGSRFRGDDKGFRILDLGCGSGAIAVALAKHFPGAVVTAADISEDALRATEQNATLNGVTIRPLRLDILAPLSAMPPVSLQDIIISNPPYIPEGERATMPRQVTGYEPGTALFVPDGDPLLFYRAIAEFAVSHLAPGGQLFAEIHSRFGEETSALFRTLFEVVELRKDIHGRDRMIRATNG